jgi:hypothetical protein
VLKNAYIDLPGPQFVSFVDPTDGVPVAKPDQPSLGAGDPSGFIQLVCISRPPRAGLTATVAPTSASIPVSAATLSVVLRDLPACA